MAVHNIEVHYGCNVPDTAYVVWLLKIGETVNTDLTLATFPTLLSAREYAEGAGRALMVPVLHDGDSLLSDKDRRKQLRRAAEALDPAEGLALLEKRMADATGSSDTDQRHHIVMEVHLKLKHLFDGGELTDPVVRERARKLSIEILRVLDMEAQT